METTIQKDSLRKKALKWWNSKNIEGQTFILIKHENLITNGENRHPHTLTGREIEILYKTVKNV